MISKTNDIMKKAFPGLNMQDSGLAEVFEMFDVRLKSLSVHAQFPGCLVKAEHGGSGDGGAAPFPQGAQGQVSPE